MARAIRITALSLALFAALAPARAEDGEGRFAVKGVGAAPCSAYVDAFEAQDVKAAQMLGWVAGYLTAVNERQAETFDVISWQTDYLIAASLSEYCKQNLETPLHAAMANMVRRLNADRVEEKSPLVSVTAAGRNRQIYQATLEKIQKRLGVDHVKAAGAFDVATRDALRAFQGENGLPQTGFPDEATLTALFAE